MRPATVVLPALVLVLVAVGCQSDGAGERAADALHDDAITVGSFDFGESELLAEIYSQGLERAGFRVDRAFRLGSREFVYPALDGGLIELVPEYAGSALQFVSMGNQSPGDDVTRTSSVLERIVEDRNIAVLEPAPAEDTNSFVVTRETADRYGLESLSDAAAAPRNFRFGGPPECPDRPLCLVGLHRVYGLEFREVMVLDAGGPQTHQALRNGYVDVALLFNTDPALAGEELVELVDDRGLQPAENVTPLVRTEAVDRWGDDLVERIDAVSRGLTTDELRELNAEVQRHGGRTAAVAAAWLDDEGIR